MKKSILLTGVLISSFGLLAQKGTAYVGGTVSFNASGLGSNTTSRSYNWSLNPEGGKFTRENLAIGLGATFGQSRIDNSNLFINKKSQYGGFIYGRYFFRPEGIRPFIGLNLQYVNGTNASNFGDTLQTKSNFTAIGMNIHTGFTYSFNSQFMLMGTIGLIGVNTTFNGNNLDDAITDFNFGLSTALSRINFGFYYTFGQKRE